MARKSTITEAIECPHCASQSVTKAGIINGTQRYRCKDCGSYFFNEFKRKRRNAAHHKTAALMYIAGAQTKEIGECLDASYPLVSKWVANAAQYVKDEPEIEALRRSLKKSSFTVSNLSEIPDRTKKRWLVIELEDDVAEGQSIVIAKQ